MFCRSLFVLLYFFFWPLNCLFFFNLRILITPLVSSNSSYLYIFNLLQDVRCTTWSTAVKVRQFFSRDLEPWVGQLPSVHNGMVWFIVFNTTFKQFSVISWRSVILVEETGVPWENHRPVASHWKTLLHNVVSRTPRHERGSNSVSNTENKRFANI
jgi:hypothetical protein